MLLKEQVCTLEQAKKIKKLGIVAESLFWHTVNIDPITPTDIIQKWQHSHFDECEKYSAYTSQELGLMIGAESLPFFDKKNDVWTSPNQKLPKSEGLGTMNECHIRAEFLIYCLLKKILTAKICNERLTVI